MSVLSDHPAFEILKEQIVDWAFEPGTQLLIVPLADSLGLSTTPTREMLFRLAQDDFIDAVARRGFFCKKPSPEYYRLEYELLFSLLTVIDSWPPLGTDKLSDPNDPLGAIYLYLGTSFGNPILAKLIRDITARTRCLRRIAMRLAPKEEQERGLELANAVRAGDRLQVTRLFREERVKRLSDLNTALGTLLLDLGVRFQTASAVIGISTMQRGERHAGF